MLHIIKAWAQYQYVLICPLVMYNNASQNTNAHLTSGCLQRVRSHDIGGSIRSQMYFYYANRAPLSILDKGSYTLCSATVCVCLSLSLCVCVCVCVYVHSIIKGNKSYTC